MIKNKASKHKTLTCAEALKEVNYEAFKEDALYDIFSDNVEGAPRVPVPKNNAA